MKKFTCAGLGPLVFAASISLAFSCWGYALAPGLVAMDSLSDYGLQDGDGTISHVSPQSQQVVHEAGVSAKQTMVRNTPRKNIIPADETCEDIQENPSPPDRE